MLIVHNIFSQVIDNQCQLISRRQLDSVYRKETNANIKETNANTKETNANTKERILLVKRVRYDKQKKQQIQQKQNQVKHEMGLQMVTQI